MQKFWQDYVSDKYGRRDEIPTNALAVLKSVFSYAMTVIDKVEVRNEEKWVGSKFVACMWVYFKAVLCDGQGPTPGDLRRILAIIRECVSWVCEDALCEHEWVTELDVILKDNDILKALSYDLDVPCPLRWRQLWFSSPSRRENRKVPCSGQHGDRNHVNNAI